MENETAAKRLTDGQINAVEGLYSTILHAEPNLKNFDVEVRITRKGEPGAFPDRETMLIGWEEIGEFLGLHPVNCSLWFGKRMHEAGVVFYKKVQKPSSSQRRRFVCGFPSAILAWCIREAQRRRSKKERLQIVRLLEKCV